MRLCPGDGEAQPQSGVSGIVPFPPREERHGAGGHPETPAQ